MKLLTNIACLFIYLCISSCDNRPDTAGNINIIASFADTAHFTTAGMKIITSLGNTKTGTMSSLYGNSLALQHAMAQNNDLVGGEFFALVTWKQQPDEHWFGAKIPGHLQSVEALKVISKGGNVTIDYQQYEGNSLVQNSDTLHKTERIKFILGQRPSVMP